MNLLPCSLETIEGRLHVRAASFELPLASPAAEMPPEGLLGIRPERVEITSSGAGTVQAVVDIVQVLGDELIADLGLPDGAILKIVAGLDHELQPGQTVGLRFPEEHIFLFERGNGRRLVGPPASQATRNS